jgi:hypothetical protein
LSGDLLHLRGVLLLHLRHNIGELRGVHACGSGGGSGRRGGGSDGSCDCLLHLLLHLLRLLLQCLLNHLVDSVLIHDRERNERGQGAELDPEGASGLCV